MSRKTVEIICDGNQQIGYGHIRRSSALAASLRKENITVRQVGLSEEAQKLLPPKESSTGKADILVFDVAEGIEEEIDKAKQQRQVTITLDWFGNAVPDINIAVYPHSEVKALKKKYIGFEYIILREEIRKQKRVNSNSDLNKVLICLGGGDLLNQGFDTALLLLEKGFDVTLVQGPLAKNIPGDHGFSLLVNPPDFPRLLAECDLAVTNGGGCLFEALYLGKAIYVLPQTEWEMKIALHAKISGAIIGIGIEELAKLSIEGITKHNENMITLVDGAGVERITKIITELA